MVKKTLLTALALALGMNSTSLATEESDNQTEIEKLRTISAALNNYKTNGFGVYAELGGELNFGPTSLFYFLGIDLDKGVGDIGLGLGANMSLLTPYGRIFYSSTAPGTPFSSSGQGFSLGTNINLSDRISLFGEYVSKSHQEEFSNEEVQGQNQAADTNKTIRAGLRLRTEF